MTDRHVISPYPVRMPPELRELLEESAKSGSRSLHAEIISRLTESFAPKTLDDVAHAKATDLDREIARLSIEGMKLSASLNDLIERAKHMIDGEERQDIQCQVLVIAEALGQTERERLHKIKQRDLLSA